MVPSPSLIKKFSGVFFSNQRPLSSENSNLGFFQIGFFHVQLFTLFLMALEVQCVIVLHVTVSSTGKENQTALP